jgi:hypothetical protein
MSTNHDAFDRMANLARWALASGPADAECDHDWRHDACRDFPRVIGLSTSSKKGRQSAHARTVVRIPNDMRPLQPREIAYCDGWARMLVTCWLAHSGQTGDYPDDQYILDLLRRDVDRGPAG